LKTWLKFALVGLANVLVSILGVWLMLNGVFGGLSGLNSLIIWYFCVIFAVEGYVLYRFTSKNTNRLHLLWATILTYVLLNALLLLFTYIYSYLGMLLLVIIMSVFATTFTAITCLIVWIIQIVKCRKRKE